MPSWTPYTEIGPFTKLVFNGQKLEEVDLNNILPVSCWKRPLHTGNEIRPQKLRIVALVS